MFLKLKLLVIISMREKQYNSKTANGYFEMCQNWRQYIKIKFVRELKGYLITKIIATIDFSMSSSYSLSENIYTRPAISLIFHVVLEEGHRLKVLTKCWELLDNRRTRKQEAGGSNTRKLRNWCSWPVIIRTIKSENETLHPRRQRRWEMHWELNWRAWRKERTRETWAWMGA